MADVSGGRVLAIKIEEEMKRSYLDYAMSVIVGRALPDVRDGLKPVHRRILYAMRELGLTPDKAHKKSARVVGEVLGKYHPHGDAAVYDTAVRMAQDFVTRYRLVDGHGNFGSVDGDSAAAMRYTEMRLSALALELLTDIDKETVDYAPNFDESLQEPEVLPARFPNLLVNGSAGIAVGMATNIPPHNLGEVIDAVMGLIDDPGIPAEQLMHVVKGPDFPTGGMILGRQGLEDAYTRGRGSIRMRGMARIEKLKSGKTQILITELPYQVNKARLIERIAELVRDKKLEGISDLRDESDRNGMRVVVELRREAKPQVVLNRLYKHTQLEESFGIILLALVDGAPRVLNLKEVLEHYLEHQKEVIRRRSQFDLARAQARAHILEGLRIALDHLDAVIALIRGSQTVEEARTGLQEQFSLSPEQAQAILDMRLQRLTALEREKVEEEYRELQERIAYLQAVLASEAMVLNIIRQELAEIRERYADPRRTRLEISTEELEEQDLIPEEDVVATLTHAGYIKRMPIGLYRSQHRGGRGVVGMHPREEDFVEHLMVTTTHYQILFFTNLGRVFRLKVHEIPEASRQSRGIPLVNLVSLEQAEWITAVIPVREFSGGYLLQATRRGLVKKTELASYDSWRRSGLLAVKLDPGDELMAVKLIQGDEEVIVGTSQGQAIRFSAREVRPTGRVSRGVRGVTLGEEDRVVGMERVHPGADLLVVTERGFGKRTPLSQFRSARRGGKGVRLLRLTERTGAVAGIKVVQPGMEVMLVSALGQMIRLKADNICCQGRISSGVTLMRLEEEDEVGAVTSLMGTGDA